LKRVLDDFLFPIVSYFTTAVIMVDGGKLKGGGDSEHEAETGGANGSNCDRKAQGIKLSAFVSRLFPGVIPLNMGLKEIEI
jgi:hypothetical protein